MTVISGSTVGSVRGLLRLEGLCVLIVCSFAYAQFGGGWGVFFAYFLLPDLSMLGYLAGPRTGAWAYNASHSYLGPLACLGLVLASSSQMSWIVALIWGAHIGFDRALGYGLKYEVGFCHTHLGLIGKLARAAEAHVPSGSAGRKP